MVNPAEGMKALCQAAAGDARILRRQIHRGCRPEQCARNAVNPLSPGLLVRPWRGTPSGMAPDPEPDAGAA